MNRILAIVILALCPLIGLAQGCVPGTPQITCTPNLDLFVPAIGSPYWGTYINADLSLLDTAVGAKQGTLTLTTNGSSGAATLSGNVLNIPQYTGTVVSVSGTTNQIDVTNPTTTPVISLDSAVTTILNRAVQSTGPISSGFIPYASASNTLLNTAYANGNIDAGSIYNAIVDGGAAGNGTTDDTAALTAGCKAATAAGKIFYLPGNSFKVTGTVTCNPSGSAGNVIRIQGVPYVTQLVSTSATADILHLGNNHSCGGLTCGSIKGVNLVGPTSTPAQNGQRALVLDDLTQFVVDTVNVSNTDIGFDMIDNCYGSVYFNVRGGFFGNNNVGLYMRTGSQSGNQIFVNDSWISGKLAAVYMSAGADGLYVTRGQFSMINTTSATQAVFMIGIDYLTSAIGGVGTVSIDKVDTEGPGGWWIHSYGTVNLTLDKGDFLANGSNPTEGILKAENAATSRFELDNVEWGGSAGYAAAQPITISGDYGNSFLHTQGWNANAGSLSFNGAAWQTNYAMDPLVISNALGGEVYGAADYRPYNSINSTHYQDGLFWQNASGVPQVSTNAATASPKWNSLIVGNSETIASSATPTFTITALQSFNILTVNVTSFTLAAGYDGQPKVLTFCQNSTGGYTITPPSNVHGFFNVGLIASKCSSQSYSYSVSQTAWLAASPGVINE